MFVAIKIKFFAHNKRKRQWSFISIISVSMSNEGEISLAGVSYPPLGQGYYDAIIFGLGFRECLLACLLLKENKRV